MYLNKKILAKVLVFMGGFGMWAQVRSKGSCVGKDFWDKNYNLISLKFIKQQSHMPLWLSGRSLPL